MIHFRHSSLILVVLVLAGCARSESFAIPLGQNAYDVIPARLAYETQPDYVINPQDELTITVFREPDLSVTEAPVEAGGGLVLPLIGRVQAAGQTSVQLANEIESRLRARDLLQPYVSVIIASTNSQNVTVDGAVTQPGVFELQGRMTLLQTIALARGANRVADLDRVAIFRTIDGERNGALFDVMAIREGRAPDPYILSGDYVIVGSSAIRSAYYDALSIIPSFGLFVPLLNQ